MIELTLNAWNDPERRRTLVALGLSLTLHALIILSAAALLALRPLASLPVPEESPVELTLIAPPEPPRAQKPAYVETTAAQEVSEAPKDAVFESDKNTRAAAEQPASGSAPLPSQNGEESPAINFENKEYAAGQQPRKAAPPPATEAAPPEPSASAMPTPRQSAQLALLEPPKARSVPRPQAVEPPRTQAEPARPDTPGYQPQTRVTRIRGNISNRGRGAVGAAATPLGRYKKMLSDAIGSRWYYYVNEQLGLLNVGTVEIRFIVRESGKAERVQVVRNTSNESFASCSTRAIMEAEIPPIPQEIVPMLEGGRIEIEYSFTILSN